MNDSILTGSCLCGELRFEAEGKPHTVAHCHCRMCQKFAGAPFATWATYAIGRVRFSGRPLKKYRSSEKAERGFCDRCGSSVSWQLIENPRFIDMCVALFDEPDRLPPAYAIWTASRLLWLHVDEHLPEYPERGPSDQD